MASVVNLVKEADISDELLVEGCASFMALNSHKGHISGHTLSPELRNKVFGNELIKEIIFDYVLTDSDGKLSIKDVLTCRVVEKTLLDYASYRLQKTRLPQFTIDFEYWDYSRASQKKLEKKFQVSKFLDTWANANHPDAGSRIPLFNLNFYVKTADKSNKDKWQDLKNILTHCANGLHSLIVCLTECNVVLKDDSPPESFVPCFDQIPLPKLQNLEVRTTLSLSGIHTKMTAWLFKSLFLANPFPNLTKLLLTIPLVGDVNGVIFQVFDHFRVQLKHFTLLVFHTSEPIANINIPLMPKLEYLSVSSPHCKTLLVVEQSQPFPSLETLILTKQFSSTLESWIQNLYFKSVKSLTAHTCLTSIRHDNTFTLEMSRQPHTSFPFLQELDIAIGIFHDDSIRNIFQQMVNLRKLSMRLWFPREITGAATWDAILVGVTPEYATTLASSRDQWDSIHLNDHGMPSHSIINLTRLESLTLNAEAGYYYGDLELIISDVSFRFAFLRMPKLHELTFRGKFGASDDMMQQWRARGSEINCFCFRCTQGSADN